MEEGRRSTTTLAHRSANASLKCGGGPCRGKARRVECIGRQGLCPITCAGLQFVSILHNKNDNIGHRPQIQPQGPLRADREGGNTTLAKRTNTHLAGHVPRPRRSRCPSRPYQQRSHRANKARRPKQEYPPSPNPHTSPGGARLPNSTNRQSLPGSDTQAL